MNANEAERYSKLKAEKDRLQRRVAELEGEVKAGAHLVAKVGDRNRELESQVRELEGKAKLAEWARHDEGCGYPINEKYGCRCGLLKAQAALTRKDDD